MIACENTSCPWWDEDGCLSEDCGAWEEGAWMNKPEEEMMSDANDVLCNIGDVIWHEVSKSLSAKCKPCPYCGNEIVYVGKCGAWYAALCANYHCPNAHILAFDTPEKAIEDWNRRAKDE